MAESTTETTTVPADRADLISELAAAHAQLARWASVEAQALAALHALDDVDLSDVPEPMHQVIREQGKEWVSEEVALVLRISGRSARDRMITAHSLVTRAPAMLELLRSGSVTHVQARTLADAVVGLSEEVGARVVARVIGRAPDQSNAGFARSLARALLAEAPVSRDEAMAVAVAERRVVITPAADGMAELWALLPAPDAMRLKTAIWRLGQQRKNRANDTVTSAGTPIDGFVRADQRRADALIELGDRYLAESDPDRALERDSPAVQVTISLATLIGADDEPAELAGYGPIPAPMARQIAFDPGCTWRRLVVDSLGQLVDYGQTRYRPPKRLADHVRARDQMCVFPACSRRAEGCEIDHIIAWEHGGGTAENNLAVLCPRHHHLKHEAGWKFARGRAGEHRWTSPAGRSYVNQPTSLTG